MVRHCLWKMSATTGACIKPGLVRRPLCHKVNLPSCVARRPLCYKVNLPRCEARRRHLTMTCDIFGTGQTNTLTLCYLLGKTYKSAHSSATLESLKSTCSTKLLEKLLTCVARQPMCHKVNLPIFEARRRHLTMTCDIFGTGQTNTLTLCYLLGKTYKLAHSSATLESLKSTCSTKLLEKLLT